MLGADRVLEALRIDVEWLANAATPAQRAKLAPDPSLADPRVRAQRLDEARNRAIDEQLRLRRELSQ